MWLPDPKLLITLENQAYMAMIKEKLKDVKRVCRSLRLSPFQAEL